jgi:uncharacterized membrane protein YebE (DUF533 family)
MPRMSFQIGSETLLALVAVAWSDGKVEPAEAEGIRQAAKQLNLPADEFSTVEEALKQPFGLEQVETVRMSRVTRLFTFAAAYWIANVDGQVPPEEEASLRMLGDRLGLSDVARERAKRAVNASMTSAQAGQAQTLDVLKLRSRLSAGLSQIGNE